LAKEKPVGREIEEWTSLDALAVVVLDDTNDFWSWNLEKDGAFSSESLSKFLSSAGDHDINDLYLSIWKGNFPKK